MNSEKLKKINEMVNTVESIDYLGINKCFPYSLVKEIRYSLVPLWFFGKKIDLPKEIVEPMLLAYREKLKAELKELGYEAEK